MRNALLSSGSTFAHLLGRGKPAASPDKPNAEFDIVDGNNLIDTETDPDKVDDQMDPKKKKNNGDLLDDETEEVLDKTKDKDESVKDGMLPGEDNDDDDRKDAKASAARGRERARCARIFATSAAARRPDVAAHLAFGTDMSASLVITTLRAVVAGESQMRAATPPAPREARSDLRTRMQQEPRYEVGTEAEARKPTGVADFAAKMKLADEKRRGIA